MPPSFPASPGTPPPSYDVFLCHRHADGRRIARWLRNRLRGYRLPREVLEKLPEAERPRRDRPLEVYLDTVYEGAGSDYWRQKVAPALAASRHLLVVWTPGASRRNPSGAWDAVWEEIESFGRLGKEDRILLVLARGDEAQPSPGHLLVRHPRMEVRRLVDRTFWRFFWLPKLFALDEELVKIAGSLHDVPSALMPDLRREERRNRHRRLSLLVGSLLLVLLSISGLLVYNAVLLKEAHRNLADALASRGVLVTTDKEPYKAALYLAAARQLVDSPRWDAVSLLVGPPIATEAGRLAIGKGTSEVRYVPGSNRLAIVGPEGIRLADLETGGRREPLAGSAGFREVRFDSAGTKLIARSSNEIAIWSLASTATAPGERFSADRSATGGVVAFGLAVNPQTDELAYGCPDGWVRLRSLRTGKAGRSFGPLADYVERVAFSPDGRYLAAVAGNSQLVRLWEVSTGRQRDLADKNFILYALEFSPDSRYLAASGTDGVAMVWKTDDGETALEARGHVGNVPALAFSPDGASLATGGTDSTIRLWSLARAAEVVRLELGDGDCQAVAFSPGGELVAGLSAAGTLSFWSVDASDALGPALRHDPGPSSMAFSPDGKKLALGGSLGLLWADRSGLNPYEIRQTLAFEALGLEPPDQLAPGYDPASARLVDPRDGRDLVALEGAGLAALAVRGDGALLAGGSAGEVDLWDMMSGKRVRALPGPGPAAVRCIAFDGDLVAAGYDRTVRIWKLAAGLATERILDLPLPADWREADCQSLALSPGGELLAATSARGPVEVWRTQTGERLSAAARPALASPDLSRLLFRTTDGRLRLSSARAPSPPGEPFASGVATDADLLFSRDGSLLAIGHDETVELWEPAVRRLRARLAKGGRPMAFDPSGEVLVTAVEAIGSLAFWNTATGERLGALRYEEAPRNVLFSPDGSVLALESLSGKGGELRLRQASPRWDVGEAERRSGFRLRGLGVERLPQTNAASGRRVGCSDLAAAEFWRAVWQVKANLTTLRDGEMASLRSAAEPLQRWIGGHPGHPLAHGAPRRLEELLALPETWRLDPTTGSEQGERVAA